ncbi:conserved protein of unknown function (Methyl-accepting chemotaxis protein) [Magnetospirillum sp. XM-1]|uniref:hypothetical protein n=1 Tax=Magnetospirillum sp. XM-1 TaxID=1663591 RepID=UPI00073DCA03|nr:hypothetical protein [Magnetospirillum sp. XM-1]CUW41457.1 conserved protein of unknown function (Methyl-accepting chemotaxis protein) [Magnetospirillum sp. XM-1]
MELMGQSSIAGGTGVCLPPARPVRWSLARKVSLALVSILFSTLLVTAFFAYYKFESVYSAQVQSRYSFVVFTIKKRVEDSLNLGFALRQLRQVQEIIEREKSRDAQILAVEVYDYRGEVLFDTDRGAIGTRVSEPLAEAIRSGMQQSFSVVDEDNLIVGLPLVNNLGKVEGGVVLRYPIAYVEKGVSGLLSQLLKSIAIALLAASAVAVIGLYALFGGVGRKLGSMEKAMGDVLSVGGLAVPDAGGDSFEERFAEFVGKTRETIDHVKDATDEVGRLDRLM